MTAVVLEFRLKKIAAASFKTNCLAIIDEVHARRVTVLITKHGRPVAKLVPANTEPSEIFNFLDGKGRVTGDIVVPAVSQEEWNDLK
jgi:prevent-host-death family protein